MAWLFVLLIPFFLLTWALAYPRAALALIAELKRQLRLHVIRREGKQAAAQFAAKLQTWGAKQGFEKELVKEAIAAHQQTVAESVGRRYADAILGEPTPVERYH